MSSVLDRLYLEYQSLGIVSNEVSRHFLSSAISLVERGLDEKSLLPSQATSSVTFLFLNLAMNLILLIKAGETF